MDSLSILADGKSLEKPTVVLWCRSGAGIVVAVEEALDHANAKRFPEPARPREKDSFRFRIQQLCDEKCLINVIAGLGSKLIKIGDADIGL